MTTSHKLAFFAGLLIILSAAWNPDAASTFTKGQYCNSRFTFCVKYPSSLLPNLQIAENDSGIILKTFDFSSVVTVTGTVNTNNLTPKELFDAGIKEMPEPEARVAVLTSVFGDDYYECSFLKGTTAYYQKVFYYAEHFIILDIRVPVNKPELMPLLRGDVLVKVPGR